MILAGRRKTMSWMGVTLVGLALGLIVGGCRRPTATPPNETTPTNGVPTDSAANTPPKAVTEPKIPGMEDALAASGRSEVTAAPVVEKPSYTRQESLPSGSMEGLCYVPFETLARTPAAPPAEPWDFSATGSVVNPLPGEIEYYRNLRIVKPSNWCLAEKHRLGYAVMDAVILFTDIKAGRKPPLDRVGFTSGFGIITCQRYDGYGLSHIGYMPVGERVLFGCVDAYPCDFVIRDAAEGKIVFEGVADPYKKLETPTDKDIERGGRPDPRAFKPDIVQSLPIRKAGAYEISCKRHPWQHARIFVMDSPYTADTSNAKKKNGIVTLNEIPAGRHSFRVWHPVLKPVHETLEVEIKPNEATEILIPFEPPDNLKKK